LSRVARRYSKALFELSLEENQIEEIGADLEIIKIVCLENPEFQTALANPLIDEKVKVKLLRDLFAQKVQSLTFRFLELLSRKKRTPFLLEIVDNFLERVLDYQGISSGILHTASPLEKAQVENIRTRIETLTGRKVILNENLDSALIGGFIIKIKDTVIDLSIRTQLDKLRTQLRQH
jgi:F-type H+-transporting ATPase subunit delta